MGVLGGFGYRLALGNRGHSPLFDLRWRETRCCRRSCTTCRRLCSWRKRYLSGRQMRRHYHCVDTGFQLHRCAALCSRCTVCFVRFDLRQEASNSSNFNHCLHLSFEGCSVRFRPTVILSLLYKWSLFFVITHQCNQCFFFFTYFSNFWAIPKLIKT